MKKGHSLVLSRIENIISVFCLPVMTRKFKKKGYPYLVMGCNLTFLVHLTISFGTNRLSQTLLIWF